MRANRATVLGGECGVIWGVLVGVWLGDLGGCPGCVLGWGLGILWSAGQLVGWGELIIWWNIFGVGC
jgi:hypothetical protein